MGAAGFPYHLLHRGGRAGAWRPIVGVLILFVCFRYLIGTVGAAPFALWFWLTGQDVWPALERMTDFEDPTPVGLAFLNVALALLILITWLLLRTLHGLRPGWLASVTPRIRWRWLAICFGLSVVALVATLVVATVVPAQGEGTEVSGRLNEFTTTTRDYLLIVLLLTPLQAAGEEYAFRGYLTQAMGGLFGRTWAAVVLPAVLFALAHGSQSAPVFFDRLAFGLVAGALVVLTGGLEAGIAMHVLNNWLAFGLALAFGDMASTLNPVGGTWWSIPVTLTQSLVYLGVVLLVFRRMRLRNTTETLQGQGVLVGPRPLV